MRKLLTLLMMLFATVTMAQLQFKTGAAGFATFLREKTIYPSYSKNHCIQGAVTVSFKLDKSGKVYGSKVTKGILSELDDEALRLVRLSSGKWKVPADYDTTIAVIVPVNFKLAGYNCERTSIKEIQDAIRSYQAEEALTNSVIGFYKNIDQAKPGQETQIIAIKSQLGIDDEYLQSRIEQGLQKIKQKDKEGACKDFLFVKNMGSRLADEYLAKYCN